MRDVIAVQDLQFGSTGKGQIAGSVAHVWHPDTVATAWGPNAGHTFRLGEKKWVHTMLATSALAPSTEQILIGPGSVLDVDKLAVEINLARDLLRGKQLIIHPQTPVLHSRHSEEERRELLRIGSTMKGTGAAVCDKIMRRDATIVRHCYKKVIETLGPATMAADMSLSLSSKIYDRAVDLSAKMIVEGAQGFSLGVHNDFYPHTTSRDVSTAQLLADCRLPFPNRIEHRFRVLGVARTYPIRVANRKDGEGAQEVQYTSGGCYSDQQEIEWASINRVPELTTVTKLPRRLFTFSYEQIIEACRIMAPDQIALTFCDYLQPADHDEGSGTRVAMGDVVHEFVKNIENVVQPYVELLSFGPTMDDIYERVANGDSQLVKIGQGMTFGGTDAG